MMHRSANHLSLQGLNVVPTSAFTVQVGRPKASWDPCRGWQNLLQSGVHALYLPTYLPA